MLRLLFLGTGTSQGVPVIACPCAVCRSGDAKDRRLRSSVLIRTDSANIVIDAGPDFRQQMLYAGIGRLDAILFTHGHKDHTGGLDDVRAFNYVLQRPMDIYAEKRVQKSLRMEYDYVFTGKKYPGIPEIIMHTIDERPFGINGNLIVPIRATHLKLPVLGFRIGNMAYITDANHIPEKEKEKMQHLECFVVNGLRKEAHIAHFSLQEALDLIEELKPRRAFITHISHQMGFHEEVQALLPSHVRLAYDGLEVTVDN
ncbi:MAG: MBL fold metallo-hydrolase [Bacteroidales bacterium]|jgi:phosphoribosyl 1,2-cyclic phosphate phosphodiesterase|nr:MBL fold metallo-hydrolase [Bacteroidales bacterium]